MCNLTRLLGKISKSAEKYTKKSKYFMNFPKITIEITQKKVYNTVTKDQKVCNE